MHKAITRTQIKLSNTSGVDHKVEYVDSMLSCSWVEHSAELSSSRKGSARKLTVYGCEQSEGFLQYMELSSRPSRWS
jgi:hypothetical protein